MSEILNYLQVDFFRKDNIRTPIYWRTELPLLSFQSWLTKSLGVKKKVIDSSKLFKVEKGSELNLHPTSGMRDFPSQPPSIETF